MAAAGTEERSSLPDPVPTLLAGEDEELAATTRNPITNAEGFTNFGFLPIPKNLRYDPAHPAHFGLLLNVVFGISATFFVANLYYCQPLLIKMSQSFDASYDDVSRIPTLIQAGYATGLVLISPLGDLVPRRPLLLLVAFVSASLTIGLALSHSLAAFQALSFLIGASSVAPQILIPLAADLAPPARRATAISIVFSGLLLGVLLARVAAGLVAEWASWRVVYYVAVGAQYAVLASLWATTPDYPAKNGHLTYFHILSSMATLAVTEPVLIQACVIMFASSAVYTSFWVTLTFLLGNDPYNYSTLVIGLFGLVGMFGVLVGPLVGWLIDGLVPWYATLVSTSALVVTQAVYTGAAGVDVAAVIVVALGIDVAQQMQQVSITTAVYGIAASARARLNAVLILSIFIGQVMGTAVGTKVFVQYGWRASAALTLGWTVFQIFILWLRGPHCERYTWFGYQGGMAFRKNAIAEKSEDVEMRAEAEQGNATKASSPADISALNGDEKNGII